MKIALTVVMAGLLGFSSLAAAADRSSPPAPAAGWEERVNLALDKKLGNVDWRNAALPDVLSAIGKSAGVAVVLDPKAVRDPAKVRITLSVPKGEGMTLRAALGNVLKLAGLRYTLKDQAIFVSTRERIVGELLAGVRGPAPAVPGVSYPMTAGDAVAATVDFYDGSEESLPQLAGDFLRMPVDARFEKAPYRDALGRLHFPGPPMIIQDPNVLDPYRRFSRKPWFLRPPYLAPLYWGPASQDVSAAKVRETEALKALVEYMKKHPDLTVGQLVQQLEAGAAKRK
ncbi:MAG: hypothetical protein ACYTGB_05020 [Planctomycetota bacterium]|jgi:hypothetical protein